ncbi:hypothetical protein [Flavihumibacter profundi]|jgi:hypothetical protein|uniref:hypothetical protein n=1 Tax=Flavihumibacter profundi TaxID=2716883 RepID=UPI001CC659E7|nr:hypothetical protein [Flavihumibacter profundi]MBZ5858733.1 hypothetical protein [Flavihumibacter profundi]
MAKSFNRRIFSLHSWLGLINGSWLLILGLSGAMLVITLAGLLLFTNIITGIIIYKKYVLKALVLRAPVKWKNWRQVHPDFTDILVYGRCYLM